MPPRGGATCRRASTAPRCWRWRGAISRQASEYVLDPAERPAPSAGLVAFIALPVRLAHATLDRVEQAGPGSKLTRPEVYAIVQRMNRALDQDEPAVA